MSAKNMKIRGPALTENFALNAKVSRAAAFDSFI